MPEAAVSAGQWASWQTVVRWRSRLIGLKRFDRTGLLKARALRLAALWLRFFYE